jgi:hypothetical protein
MIGCACQDVAGGSWWPRPLAAMPAYISVFSLPADLQPMCAPLPCFRSLRDTSVPGFQGLPLFIGGLSMGGCIAFQAVLREVRAGMI